MNIIQKVILKLIQLVEYFEYRNLDLDQYDVNKKIINSTRIIEKVESDSGFVDAYSISETQPYDIYEINLDNGYKLQCADNHIVFDTEFNEVFIKDLIVGCKLQTDIGLSSVINIRKYNTKVGMLDLSIASDDHRYYTNGILSHNTVIAGIYLVWYLLFHYDKNIMLASNKGDTSKEILSKAKQIIENLPFYLKPGMTSWNAYSISTDANSKILATTTTDKAAIGYTIHLLYLDEFAHIKKHIQKPFFDNIYPVISSSKSSKLIMTSTPGGYDLFQDIYQKSVDGVNKFKNIKIPYYMVPGRDEEWADAERANLGEEEFNEQFNCSFLRSDTLLLKSKELAKINKDVTDYKFHEIDQLDKYQVDYANFTFVDGVVPEDLGDTNRFFIGSIDLAEGGGGDHTVFQIFEIVPKKDLEGLQSEMFDLNKFFKFRQVAMYRRNDIPIDDFAKFMYIMLFGGVFDIENIRIVLEWNTYGAVFVEKLKHTLGGEDYDESIFIKTFHRKGAKHPKIGLRQDKEVKPKNCVELKNKISNGTVDITEKKTVDEFGYFTKLKNGSYAAAKGHDDTVMACVNIVEMFNQTILTDIISELFEHIPQEDQTRINEIMGLTYGRDTSTDYLADDFLSSGMSIGDELDFM